VTDVGVILSATPVALKFNSAGGIQRRNTGRQRGNVSERSELAGAQRRAHALCANTPPCNVSTVAPLLVCEQAAETDERLGVRAYASGLEFTPHGPLSTGTVQARPSHELLLLQNVEVKASGTKP
jgi:hypothetical protein